MNQSQSQTQQGRGSAQFQLRLPDDLKTRLQDAADASGRSINSEIVAALTEKFSPARVGAKAVADLFKFIDAAKDDEEFSDRIRETNYFLKELYPSANLVADKDGSIRIEGHLLP